MKHRRGIDLLEGATAAIGSADKLAWLSLEKLGDQYTLGAQCASCGRIRWFNRKYLESRFGLTVYVNRLAPRLKCTGCGHRGRNAWIVGRVGA